MKDANVSPVHSNSIRVENKGFKCLTSYSNSIKVDNEEYKRLPSLPQVVLEMTMNDANFSLPHSNSITDDTKDTNVTLAHLKNSVRLLGMTIDEGYKCFTSSSE